MSYSANIGTTNILDKNLIISELEDLSLHYENLTNPNFDSYTASGTEYYTFSGMQMSVDMTTEDLLVIDARVDLSVNSTAGEDIIVEVSFTATAGIGSGGASKHRIFAGQANAFGADTSLVVRAVWTVTSDATVTYSLQARCLNVASTGTTTVCSYQRDMSVLKFKRSNDNNQTFL